MTCRAVPQRPKNSCSPPASRVSRVLGDLPTPGDPTREVRAEVLRYLILGGCEDHPGADWGLQLEGARITGTLDLSFATARGITSLVYCRFDQPIAALQTQFQLLNLNGSTLPGLFAQGAKVAGSVTLDSATATATVDVNSAEIGGQLDCENAKLSAQTGEALTAHSSRITGGVFLRRVTATATVNLSSAEIGG